MQLRDEILMLDINDSRPTLPLVLGVAPYSPKREKKKNLTN